MVKKRLKLPNGYGSIVNLGKKRRKPYGAKVTIGYDPSGKQLRKYIGYYASYNEALTALSQYNFNPYDIDISKFTLDEAFERYKSWKFKDLSGSAILGYTSAYKHLDNYSNTPLIHITSTMIQDIFDEGRIGYATQRKIIVIFNQLYTYYSEDIPQLRKITNKIKLNRNVKPNKSNDKDKKVFTDNEIQILWDNINNFNDLDIILILLYTGFRINELLEIKTTNVFLNECYIIGGNKTKASINRKVPIHSKIFNLVKSRYNPNREFLIRNKFDMKFKYSNFKRERFDRIMDALKMEHTIHDTRHTVATNLQINGADKVAIRKILGHAGEDITEQVYIHSKIDYLKKNIELLK